MTSTGSLLWRLSCRACCNDVDPDRPTGVCPTCGQALFAEYDLEHLDPRRWLAALPARARSLWRYRELLPVRDDRHIATLGEGGSPILDLGEISAAPGIRVLEKDDGGLPTGSFKARGMAVAVSRARELGLEELFVPSAGNAGVALAAYGARAGRRVRVYLPEQAPASIAEAARTFGAEVIALPGTLREVGAAARQAERARSAFDLSTLREPYRVEGKKTMGFEIFEELGADALPDAILYPTGGGTGLIGMWRAFRTLRSLGLLERIPRLYAIQPEGCAPVVRALDDGATQVAGWDEPRTLAPGLLVPAPFAGERILEAIRESGGGGIRVTDRSILGAMRQLGDRHGISASPEAAAPYAALPALVERRAIRGGETVLLYGTGTGLGFSIPTLERSLEGGTGTGR
ncbi:MAG TPA: threonine synthase [Thermoplasmata archaeon]|nr:threonine synthase [Thermoplasmata archaeon]